MLLSVQKRLHFSADERFIPSVNRPPLQLGGLPQKSNVPNYGTKTQHQVTVGLEPATLWSLA